MWRWSVAVECGGGLAGVGNLLARMAVITPPSISRPLPVMGAEQEAGCRQGQQFIGSHMRQLPFLLRAIGLKLLTRKTRNVAPTQAGEQLIATLRPAIDDIDARLSALSALRERPAGRLRITTSRHAAETILWPVVSPMQQDHPDLSVEISIDGQLTDIVADRFDAGIRLGEQVAKDMIAVPIGPDLRMAVVGAPGYFAARGRPMTPQDLTAHACINIRMPSKGGLYAWEFGKDGRDLNVRVEGPLVINDVPMILRAAADGIGLACVMEDQASALLASGRLERVLEDWCPPFPGYHLNYPDRRQQTPAFALLVNSLRRRRSA